MKKSTAGRWLICMLLCILCGSAAHSESLQSNKDAELPAYTIADDVLTWYSENNENRSFTVPEGVKEIGSGAFLGNQYLEEVVLPENVLVISESAFEQCRALKHVDFPQTLLFIGSSAFSGCINLEAITLPSNLLVIGDCAFTETGSLGTVVIPEKLRVLGDGAFRKSKIAELVILPCWDIYISDDLVDEDAECTIVLRTGERAFAELIVERYGDGGMVKVVVEEGEE